MTNPKLQIIDRLYGQLIALLEVERVVVLTTIEENEMDQATTDLIGRLNTSTNKIAAKIQALIDKATSAGSASAAEIDAALSPVVDQLEAMGADPANPGV